MFIAFFLLDSLVALDFNQLSEVNILLRLVFCLCNICKVMKVIANLVTPCLTNSLLLVNFLSVQSQYMVVNVVCKLNVT